jgi:hypothetical protein
MRLARLAWIPLILFKLYLNSNRVANPSSLSQARWSAGAPVQRADHGGRMTRRTPGLAAVRRGRKGLYVNRSLQG